MRIAASPPDLRLEKLVPDKFTVALIQMSCGPEPADNLAKALDRVSEAARKGADVVCLPELFQTQYFCQREDATLFDLAEPIPGAGTEKLAAAARKIPGCRITVRKVSENFACFRAPKGPFFAAMASSVRRVRKTPTVFSVTTGFNDMHFFAHELGIPTVGYGPGGMDIHAVDERASVRALVSAAKIYADLLTSFAG